MVSNSNLALTRKKSSEHPLLQYEHGGCNICKFLDQSFKMLIYKTQSSFTTNLYLRSN